MIENIVQSWQDIFGTLNLLWFGAISLGVIFGYSCESGGFCLRAAIEEWANKSDRPSKEVFRPSSRTLQYILAILTAMLGTQLLLSLDLIHMEQAIYNTSRFAPFAVILGGTLFGIGMVLSGGCISRLCALCARGNLRAIWTILIIAIVSYATISGILAPLRIATQSFGPTFEPISSVYLLWIAAPLLAGAALLLLAKKKARARDIFWGLLVGLTIPLGWFVTSSLGTDLFIQDMLEQQSMTFTRPIAHSLALLTTGLQPNLIWGAGLVIGTLAGAFLSALIGGRLFVEGFRHEAEPIRYASGAVLMGFGGVIALGCSMGQGLSGMSALSVAAPLALAFMIASAFITMKILQK